MAVLRQPRTCDGALQRGGRWRGSLEGPGDSRCPGLSQLQTQRPASPAGLLPSLPTAGDSHLPWVKTQVLLWPTPSSLPPNSAPATHAPCCSSTTLGSVLPQGLCTAAPSGFCQVFPRLASSSPPSSLGFTVTLEGPSLSPITFEPLFPTLAPILYPCHVPRIALRGH